MLPNLEIDWTQDPRTLREIYKQTNFDDEFCRLIRKDVISILSPQLFPDPHNLIYDETVIQKHLIGRLERLICDLDENAPQHEVDRIFGQIKTLKQPSRLCRKVLKTGDVLFSCNDCGLDGTCVVCIDCFHKSAHKDHNYRMANTEGGGCCDCGDNEAWKQHPACSDHMAIDQPTLRLADFEDIQLRRKQIDNDKRGILEKISLLQKGTAERFFIICQASLHYARLMLNWNEYNSLPNNLEIVSDDPELAPLLSRDPKSKNFFTVLFNDEVHTYDHVINTLVKIIKCTKMTASIMASTVSREGRSFVYRNVYKECKHVRDAIACVRDSGQGPLKVEVIHGSLLAHQAFAIKLIVWIREMSLLCDAFRIITAYTLLGTYDPMPEMCRRSSIDESPDETLLERLMLTSTLVWKEVRVDWNHLYVATLLTEYSIKEKFARLITRIYPNLIQDFIDDDHDHSVSILTMTTQLYTVPSLICMLIEEEDALRIIAKALLDTCKNTKREGAAINFDSRHTFDLNSLKRGFSIIMDLRNLINIEPTKWTSLLRANVIGAVRTFLSLLSSMQGMDSVRRQLGQHLEYEPEWETGMTLQNRLIGFIGRLVSYCSLDEEVLCETLRETQARLFKDCSFKTITRELFGHQAGCIQYDVSTLPVSVHLPLTRFAVALIVELMQRRPSASNSNITGQPYDESLVILTTSAIVDETNSGSSSENSRHSMIDIMEHSLRTEVMIAQFRSGMWRRNGYSLVNQILYFSGPLMRKEMFDRDILALQECAACCEANKFLIHLLNKFNLFGWVTSETTREPLVDPKAVSYYNDEEIMTQTMSLGEEFLQLLLTCICERYRVGIGKIEPDDVIKNEIIQLLCIGPFTRSDLTQKLYVNDNELDCIKAVANLRRSTESSTGKYELKEELYARFNPFFYHYNRRHQSQALNVQLKRKKNLKEPLACCPPPRPVELTAQFRNLNELLKCDITLIIIQKILRRTLGPPENVQECSTKAPIAYSASDLQLDLCLHLIGLGLWEQERQPMEFGFIEAANEKDIMRLLKECYERAKRSRDMIYWIMQKTNNLIDSIDLNELSDYKSRVYSGIRSRFNLILSACDTVKQESKKRNSELAAQRRERILAQMRAKQNDFLSNPSTQQLISETESKGPTKQPSTIALTTTTTTSTSSSSTGEPTRAKQTKSSQASASTTETAMCCDDNEDNDDDDDDDDVKSMDTESITMIESEGAGQQAVVVGPLEESHLCILCRDEQRVAFDKPTMVLLATIQRSAVMSKNREQRRIPNYSLTPSNRLKHLFQVQLANSGASGGNTSTPEVYSFTSDDSWTFDATYMPGDLFFGPHITTCGHAMHYDCWKGFFDMAVKRETSRPNRSARHTSFDLDKGEILCPLCECISNALIPLLPDFTCFVRRRLGKDFGPMGGTIFGCNQMTLARSSENLSASLHALRGTVDMFKHIRHLKDVGTSPSSLAQRRDDVVGEDKYMRLLQPRPINEVLEELDEAEALLLRDFITTVRGEKVSSSVCTKDLLGSISSLADRIHSMGLDIDSISGSTDMHHARVFMMTSWSIAYTIQAHEKVARFKGTPIFEDIDSPKNLCLSSLIRFSLSSMMTHQSDMMQSLLVKKLRYLLINEEHLSASPCCLDVDAFEMFVSIFILLQKLHSHLDESSSAMLFDRDLSTGEGCSSSTTSATSTSANRSTGSSGQRQQDEQQSAGLSWTTSAYDHEYFRNMLHLMLILNLVQVIVTMQTELASTNESTTGQQSQQKDDCDDASSSSGSAEATNEAHVLYNFYKEIMLASGHPNSRLPEQNQKLIERVRCRLLPFLRSCAIFFHHLSHIKPPQVLHTKSALFEGKDFVNCSNSNRPTHLESQLKRQQHQQQQTGGSCPLSAAPTEYFKPQERRREHFDLANFETANTEFMALCHYLDLPGDFGCLLKSRDVRHLASGWLRHSRVLLLIKSALENAGDHEKQQQQQQEEPSKSEPASSGSLSEEEAPLMGPTKSSSELMPIKLIHQPHSVNRLVDLPYDYSELVDKVSDFTCPSNRNEDSRTPTMCLVCGLMLCSQSYCCQRDLNELASNYQQILSRQEEARRALMQASNSSSSTSAAAGGSSASASTSSANYHHHHQSSSRATPQRQPPSTSGAAASAGQGPLGFRFLPNNAQIAAAAAAATEAALSFSPVVGGGAGAGGGGGGRTGPNALRNLQADERSPLANVFNAHIHQQLVGSCTYHAHECCAGVGVFLRIRNCQILLLSGRSKGCYMPAPYIDDHGETDFGLMRGNPLHLNKQHYERLQQMWMNHSIPEQISRTLEYSSYASNINWHLH